MNHLFTSSRRQISHQVCFSPLDGPFAAWKLRKIEEFERYVCIWKQQLSFLCDFLVLEPFHVNIEGSQVLEVFALRDEQIG